MFLSLSCRESIRSATGAAVDPMKKVFVVYGHDRSTRTQVDAMLRRWSLRAPDLGPIALPRRHAHRKASSITGRATIRWSSTRNVQGYIYVPFSDNVEGAGQPLANAVAESFLATIKRELVTTPWVSNNRSSSTLCSPVLVDEPAQGGLCPEDRRTL